LPRKLEAALGAEKPEPEPSAPQTALEAWLDQSERFRVVGKLGAGGMGVVYDALDLERGERVALKTLRTSNAQTLYRFKQEFRALAEVVHPRLVRLYELFADGDHWFFTMELVEDGVDMLTFLRDGRYAHASGELLGSAETVQSWPPPGESAVAETRVDSVRGQRVREGGGGTTARERTSERAQVAPPLSYTRVRTGFAQLAEGVHALHERGRLHRDLKPENVFVRTASEQVVLLDFGLVAALESTGQARTSLPHLQTETDELPESERTSRTYHATQAGLVAGTVEYMAPEQGLAQPLTAAADWYAVGIMLYEALTGRLPYRGSSARILTDKLERDPRPPVQLLPETPADLSDLCMALLRRSPGERPLGAEVIARLGGLADHDTSRSVFVGRASALRVLQAAMAEAAHGLTLASVHGPSGAGKSTLLLQFFAELAHDDHTLVLAGRCYEHEFIPFKALDSLMDALTRHLLQLPRAELNTILPPDGRVLARVFPVLGRLYARPAREADGSDPHAVRSRAFAAMRVLLKNLSERARLVLYIDDLQWGDGDSATLLSDVLAGPDAPRALIILSYRSEHGHSSTLRALTGVCREACAPGRVFELDVGALGPDDARALATHLVSTTQAGWGVPWVVEQAAGSAFLIHELARYLSAGGAPTGVAGLSLDDILWERVRALPDASQALLGVLAVAGRPLKKRHAQRAAQLSTFAPGLAAALTSARLMRSEGSGADTALAPFHDRVRESIVARTSPVKLAEYARALARTLDEARDADAETLAVLYERAGELGLASRHYAAAVPVAVAALAFEHAERLAQKAIALAQTDEECASAYEAAVHCLQDMARFPEAYALTREGCARLGLELPEKFVPPLLVADLLAVQAKLWRRSSAHLLALPTMPAGRLLLAVRLANAGAKAAFQCRPELCVALCTKIVRLCLAHGNTPDCAIAYMVFGAIFQGGILGRYATGYELGQLALALVDKYQNERQRAEVSFVVGYFGTSWLKPARDAEALWSVAYSAGQKSGDLFHMGCAAAGRMMSLAMRGVPLQELERESEELAHTLTRSGLREPLAVVLSVRQLARDLRGATHAPGSWHDDEYDETAALAAWHTFGASHFGHYCLLARAQAHYLRDRTEEAAELLARAAPLAPASKGMLHSAEHVFLEALVTARAETLPRAERALRVLNAARQLKAWARRCHENFAAKAELVWAEALRLLGRERAARSAYARAAQLASRCGCSHVEAMAHVCAARLGESGASEAARAAFARWGATALAAR
jgi:serine/threonine protein kinase